MRDERRWTVAGVEHNEVVGAFHHVLTRVSPATWHRAPTPRKWSPAAVVLHVCESYEFGRDAVAGAPGMRLRVSPLVAWLSGRLLLPLFLATRQFPGGAHAPAEVVPDLEEALQLTQEAAAVRLQRVSAEAAAALRRAAGAQPSVTVTHAYFGPLQPFAVLRLLSAHTRHHARGLARLATD